MLVYYFVPFISICLTLSSYVPSGRISVAVRNRTHVYMNLSDHEDLGSHLL